MYLLTWSKNLLQMIGGWDVLCPRQTFLKMFPKTWASFELSTQKVDSWPLVRKFSTAPAHLGSFTFINCPITIVKNCIIIIFIIVQALS